MLPRNLRSSRTNLIGVIPADIANPFSSAMLEGLSASAAARSLMTAISGNDPAKEAESLTGLIDAGVDGWSSTPAEAMTRRSPQQRDACPLCCSTAMLPMAVSIW